MIVNASPSDTGDSRSWIPESLRREHDALHGALESATKRTDAVGSAARDVAAVLHRHFVREEEIALPPLGALVDVARGVTPAHVETLLTMTATLERELPQMIEEHRAIRAAVARLEIAARDAGATDLVTFAQQLALHARTEEEVMYPAAIVVGRMLRRLPTIGGAHVGEPSRSA